MQNQELLARLASIPICTAHDAPERVPKRPGYYAIFIDNPRALPNPFCERVKSGLIYIGIATKSLRERLVTQDLWHNKPSTFFRGLGAILGSRPPRGSLVGRKNNKNYCFSRDDTTEIITWINKHLKVSWIEVEPALTKIEESMIKVHSPILNTRHNPASLVELRELRDRCRSQANAL